MSWLSYLIPQNIARFSSLYNHDIRVVEEAGSTKLLVNGVRQSGAYIEMLWNDAFVTFHLAQIFHPKRILVLGVGGGSVLHILTTFFPQAHVDAVDIDPMMIEIGKKYFNLTKLRQVHFIVSDAYAFVRRRKNIKRYDLVVVDLFFGNEIPTFVDSVTFLKLLHCILTPRGTLVINYITDGMYREKGHLLLDKLRQIFQSVSDREIFHNRFFYAST